MLTEELLAPCLRLLKIYSSSWIFDLFVLFKDRLRIAINNLEGVFYMSIFIIFVGTLPEQLGAMSDSWQQQSRCDTGDLLNILFFILRQKRSKTF